ncbi:MAG: hypothetical protein RIR51_511 [Bacteroidota bacterium]|jgi:mannose-6-phosphate isomerase-like protein (cupin superfamily)
MNLNFKNTDSVFTELEKYILEQNFSIDRFDFNRPWGGFFVLKEEDAPSFAQKYFPELDFNKIQITNKLSPKFLVVFPQKRLSWQYHFRRAEIWKVIQGPVKVGISETDQEEEPQTFHVGDTISLYQGQRHRLIGDNLIGIVAEIWQHTDENSPSDEDDIVRLQDDFGR